MTWKSHIAIAVGVSAPFNPLFVPIAVIGSTAPDWSEWILKFFGIRVKHRGATHYLYIPVIIILIGVMLKVSLITWFGVGYLTHWLADSLTITGVPLSQFDNHRIHFFGGKLRTGEYKEYVISFMFLFLSLSISQSSFASLSFTNGLFGSEEVYKYDNFNPYWTQYGELYQDKIIDEKTYKENKFKIF